TVAYDGGDYRTAAEAALRAQTALDLIARYEAEKSMLLADAMLDWAGGAKAGDRYPSEMASAQAARGQAEAAYLGRGWLAAIAKADEATSILDAIAKQDADYALWLAQAWIDWDVRTEAPKYYSDPYARAVAALEGAHDAYSQEAWISAIDRAMTSAAISYDGIAGAEAEATVNQAYEWLSWAHGIEAPYNYPAEYSRSSEALDKAYDEYVDGYWIPAADRAREAIAALQGVGPVERPAPPVVVVQKPVLPRTYTVRILPARTDCFWRIAGYPFIYSDPLKWPVLYEANKKLLKDPANPDLIHAGQVFVIPALGNEVREGAWDSKKEYPAFPKN
ncbi:MAG: hypothetical protein Q8M76_13030, partial [Spirochaetaceae bacterium]|nr:hypothetical protein [Spirochaetaceae bacterium]